MDFQESIKLSDIFRPFECVIVGDDSAFANGINEIHRVREGDITFVDHEKYYKKALSSDASFIIIDQKVDQNFGKTLIVCENPFDVYEQIVKTLRPFISVANTENQIIDPSAIIEPNVQIGANVSIGKNCYIQSNVYIASYTIIGDNVIIQSNSSIGTDAFYFKKKAEIYQKWTSGGSVIIEDNVDIGAGCTINKGVSSETIIGKGTKIDCQVHVGHGVIIGENCLLAAQVGIAGKSRLGDNVVLYGQVGVAQNIQIGENTVVLAKSGVSKNLDANKVYFGYPAVEAKEKYRELATLRQMTRDKMKKATE